jgi:hypothetical protein
MQSEFEHLFAVTKGRKSLERQFTDPPKNNDTARTTP